MVYLPSTAVLCDPCNTRLVEDPRGGGLVRAPVDLNLRYAGFLCYVPCVHVQQSGKRGGVVRSILVLSRFGSFLEQLRLAGACWVVNLLCILRTAQPQSVLVRSPLSYSLRSSTKN